MGVAIRMDMTTSNTKIFENKRHMEKTDAPKNFRKPISLVRCSAIKEARPKTPRHEMNIANKVKATARFPIPSESLNFFEFSSFTIL